MNKILQEKIIWINSVIGNNFNYDIYGVIHPEAKNLTVQ